MTIFEPKEKHEIEMFVLSLLVAAFVFMLGWGGLQAYRGVVWAVGEIKAEIWGK